MQVETSGTVRRAYAGAAAQLAKHASDKRVDKLVADALAPFSEGAGDAASGSGGSGGASADARLVSGLLLRELLR